MSVDGTVSVAIAIGVLRASGCTVLCEESEESQGKVMVKVTSPDGTIHHGFVMTPRLSRHSTVGLARKFGIPAHHFYHPLEVEGFTPEDIQ